jgi:predicted transcriptional regulator
MSGKRSKLEIYLDILRIINKGETKPTRIMYRANLSWIPLQEVFQSLIAQGIIDESERNKRKQYTITEKGRRALRYFEGMAKLIKTEPIRQPIP